MLRFVERVVKVSGRVWMRRPIFWAVFVHPAKDIEGHDVSERSYIEHLNLQKSAGAGQKGHETVVPAATTGHCALLCSPQIWRA